MLRSLKEFVLDTPQEYWVVINGYHFHKSFWGVLCFVAAVVFFTLDLVVVAVVFLFASVILITLSIVGHIYTNNKPYFKLWDKER